MKRSGGVTAAAIVLFLGSALLVFSGVMMALVPSMPEVAKEPNPLGLGFFYFEAGFMLVLAGWGIATAVGILRLRNWARISILVMSGLTIVILLFGALGALAVVPMMNQGAKMPPGLVMIIGIFYLAFLGIPLGIAVWWLVLFLKKGVRAQFEASARIVASEPMAIPVSPLAAIPRVTESSAGRIPVSILVVAIYLVAVAPMSLFSLAIPFFRRMPMLLFGHFFVADSIRIFFVLLAAIHLCLGIGLLRRMKWAWIGTCAYSVLLIVNSLVTALTPHVVDRMAEIMGQFMPGYSQLYVSSPGIRLEFYGGMIFGISLPVAALYFLVTRRKAYREACAGKA